MPKSNKNLRSQPINLPPEAADLNAVSRVTARAIHKQHSAVEAGRRILEMTGEDGDREGLRDTPYRFAKAYQALLDGYNLTPDEAVGKGIFASEGQGLVAVEDVEFYSMCEHHLLPFWGKATVAYFPGEKILGLSKIPRLVDVFARRVQVQERITQQVLDAVQDLIAPRAVMVKVQAQHLCMMMRGVEKQQSQTTTQSIYGYEKLQDYEKQQLLRLMK
ncbi:GTP cyclohydrolase I FolE [Oligoflexus tunisiensis]|uniref:GTP cyclohydrolase I FolE n=1 Tax=Oligoflexus tunisiensis TaxID=708132 RepID=UPI000A8571F8|nr:GTP cyclohydrolase I FolE [Oligoflexus tunisiensis]